LVTDLDNPQSPQHSSGRELTQRGLSITLRDPGSSGLITYRRLDQPN